MLNGADSYQNRESMDPYDVARQKPVRQYQKPLLQPQQIRWATRICSTCDTAGVIDIDLKLDQHSSLTKPIL